MDRMRIHCREQAGNSYCCQCGETFLQPPGPGLVHGSDEQPVCRPCGQRQDPRMTSLLDLALVAERVGRSFRHLLTPPMESLLELARAAENYTHTTSFPQRRVS